MMTPQKFNERMQTFERREKMEEFSGIRDVYWLLLNLSWWNRLYLYCYFKLQKSDQNLIGFTVYQGLIGMQASFLFKDIKKALMRSNYRKAKKHFKELCHCLLKKIPLSWEGPGIFEILWLRLRLMWG